MEYKHIGNFTPGNWGPMVALSVAFHLGIFLAIIFVPDTIPAKNFTGTVYEVELVTLPPAAESKQPGPSSKRTRLATPAKKKTTTKTRRISVQKKKEKPLIVAKRTLETKMIAPKKKSLSSAHLIDRAISKIEDRVRREDQENQEDQVDRAIRELEKKSDRLGQSVPEGGGRSAMAGVSTDIYRMEVEAQIKSNWSYPVALRESKDLEAIVIIKVNKTGQIINFRFKKRSTDQTFNDSVLKAVERSEPLPPIPDILRKRDEEIEVKFNLKDLKT